MYFVERARDSRAHTDENWRLGFESKHREIDVDVLARNIYSHLNQLSPISVADVVIDIGAGGGALAKALERIYEEVGARYIMVDVEEVLELGFKPKQDSIFGVFPNNLTEIQSRLTVEGGILRHVIANSILHYVKHDGFLPQFFESLCSLMQPGSTGFVGDVPCTELKRAQSIAENRTFTDSKSNFSYLDFARIADTCASFGVSFFSIPQPNEFPMSPHRVDLLFTKNRKSDLWS